MKRKEPAHLEDPTYRASSSTTSPYVGDYEDRTKKPRGNDYEVFLSFRGQDTRKGFTDHLYTSLVNAGIHVFRDDNELPVGEEIGPELLCSISQSRISIPIISKNYTSSKWCLRELTQMLKCRRSKGQIVLPVFYKVEPWQLRHLTWRLGYDGNANKESPNEMAMKEWEEPLKEVSSLKGWESEKIDNGHEGALVKTIVTKVMSELKRLFQLIVPEQLVGIDDHVKEIMSWIDAEYNGTRIVGIYGMGGIGKTTLAKVLYNTLSGHFEYLSFVANIRETYRCKGIELLQKQLISDLVGSSCDVSNVDEGIALIKSRLIHKKVLVLLDDMDANTHLNALAGDGSWFKAGSIVIITTRNKSILDEARAGYMYQLKELPLDQSLILFSRHAFRKNFPHGDYEVISRDVVSTTGGLPLALEVIGSFLCGKRCEVWKDTLLKLKKVPHRKVQEKLKISYEALEYEEQQIFLDIACFFIGSSKQNPTYMWDACDFFPNQGIEVLSLMSLIKIDEDGKVHMHDQLRDLGREIVRLENQKKPPKRSRLWIHDEAVDVLDCNKGSSRVEALRLDKDGRGRTYMSEQFKDLTNLRFLELNAVNLVGDFQNLLPQLTWLWWERCPSDFAAVNFRPKKLVILNLSWSGISEDWGGWGPLKMATKLKALNLSHCHSLRRTPDLSAFESLEHLILENCWNLEEIHPTIGDIRTLVSLNVKSCWKLKELPVGVGRMKELRELHLNHTVIREIPPISSGCMMKLETLIVGPSDLVQLPKSIGSFVSLTQLRLSDTLIEELPESIGSLVSLTQLNLSDTWIGELPKSIGSLKKLETLRLAWCRRIAQLPESVGSLVSLTRLNLNTTWIEELPESIGCLKELVSLRASWCRRLAKLPESIGSLVSLQRLVLHGSNLLREIPSSIGMLASLTELDLGHTDIAELPESIKNLQNLRILDICGTRITELPTAIGMLAKLQELRASGCKNLKGIPSSIGELASLNKLDLDRSDISWIEESIGHLKELESLRASQCRQLAKLPESIGSLVSLQRLILHGSNSLREIPSSIGMLASLTELDLGYTDIAELPESIGNLQNLRILDICGTRITELPNAIGMLAKLQELRASGCKNLKGIPSSIGKLASLNKLDLDWSDISWIEESVGYLKELESLRASWCRRLAKLPESIGSLVSLQRLILHGSDSLREIPSSIGMLASLTELDLGYTGIAELPESIKNLQNLRILDICGTRITELPNAIGMLAKLQELRASGCKNLKGIPSSIGKLGFTKQA